MWTATTSLTSSVRSELPATLGLFSPVNGEAEGFCVYQ
jgi:hypothetical protein